MQIDGEVRGNILNGGMLALYMLRNVICESNVINDSPTNGIFVSLPSMDVTVRNNTVRQSKYSAIAIKPQVEHPAAGRMNDSTGIVIEGNTLVPQYNGIEIDGTSGDATQGRALGIALRSNLVQLNDFAGIYLLRADAPIVDNNQIHFIGADASRRGEEGRQNIIDFASAGIYVDVEVSRPRIENNEIERQAAANEPQVMQNAVVLNGPNVTDAVIRNNHFRRYRDDWVHSPCEQDFGVQDQNGVYDRTQQLHTFDNNRCDTSLE